MLAREMLLNQQGIHRGLRIYRKGDESHLSDLLSDNGMIDSLVGILAPCG